MPESDDPRRSAAAKQPPKLQLESMDIAADKRAALKRLFPEVFTEDAIDFERFKQVLGEDVAIEQERFGLTWPGKAACMRVIQQPSAATLKPCRAESVDFDATDNVFIEGDNLEVLKLLQKAYYGRVKMIYIDPPYNTGKEFIYPDKYTETLATYLQYTGQKDSEGRKFASNLDTDGRYHSNWLNMMYPRLYLARNLLRDDGVIFISIDDNECANLKALCDQVFGEENFICTFTWNTKKGAQGMTTKYMTVSNHEYILVYSQNCDCFRFFGLDRDKQGFANPDNDPRGVWKRQYLQRLGQGLPTRQLSDPATGRTFAFATPYTQAKLDQWVAEDRIIFPAKATGYPARKEFFNEYKHKQQLTTALGLFPTKASTEKLYALFNGQKIFTNPKPAKLLNFLVQSVTTETDLILDFFAGSATTAHAVMQVNTEDDGNRRYICVQLPEPCDPQSEAYQAGYQTIAAIGRERIRRAAKQIASQTELYVQNKPDLGFKAFELAPSNFKPWQSDINKIENLEQQLIDHVDHIDAASSQEDILYELLLTLGLPLTTKLDKIQLADKNVFAIGHAGSEPAELLICLDKNLNQAVIDAMAAQAPQQVICLDQGFNHNDQLKANAVQTFKLRAQQIGREIVFRTV